MTERTRRVDLTLEDKGNSETHHHHPIIGLQMTWVGAKSWDKPGSIDDVWDLKDFVLWIIVGAPED